MPGKLAINNEPMRTFTIYKHPAQGFEAVKVGFSWPAFFLESSGCWSKSCGVLPVYGLFFISHFLLAKNSRTTPIRAVRRQSYLSSSSQAILRYGWFRLSKETNGESPASSNAVMSRPSPYRLKRPRPQSPRRQNQSSRHIRPPAASVEPREWGFPQGARAASSSESC